MYLNCIYRLVPTKQRALSVSTVKAISSGKITICSEIYTKLINAMRGLEVEIFNAKLGVVRIHNCP
jgi:ribosomal protein S8